MLIHVGDFYKQLRAAQAVRVRLFQKSLGWRVAPALARLDGFRKIKPVRQAALVIRQIERLRGFDLQLCANGTGFASFCVYEDVKTISRSRGLTFSYVCFSMPYIHSTRRLSSSNGRSIAFWIEA